MIHCKGCHKDIEEVVLETVTRTYGRIEDGRFVPMSGEHNNTEHTVARCVACRANLLVNFVEEPKKK